MDVESEVEENQAREGHQLGEVWFTFRDEVYEDDGGEE